jgi:hypothetical protein
LPVEGCRAHGLDGELESLVGETAHLELPFGTSDVGVVRVQRREVGRVLHEILLR